MSDLLPRTQPPASRWERVRAPALTVGGLAALTVALRLRDPHESGSWGICPSAALGFWCPGCGGLRAVNDLTHGDLASAASSNLLFFVSIPLVLWLLVRWVRDRWRGHARVLDPRLVNLAATAFVALAVVFGVLRNLPGSSLAP